MNLLLNDFFIAAVRAAKGKDYELDSLEKLEEFESIDRHILATQLDEAERILEKIKESEGRKPIKKIKAISERIGNLRELLREKHPDDEQITFEDEIITPPFLEEIYSMLDEFDQMQSEKTFQPIRVHEVAEHPFHLLNLQPPPAK